MRLHNPTMPLTLKRRFRWSFPPALERRFGVANPQAITRQSVSHRSSGEIIVGCRKKAGTISRHLLCLIQTFEFKANLHHCPGIEEFRRAAGKEFKRPRGLADAEVIVQHRRTNSVVDGFAESPVCGLYKVFPSFQPLTL